ncbi:hypothetical protein GCM10010232_22640 [Streptomyces amakusaensis]|uniref:DUF4184 family protein n=1 Tax=Streptomyces amakusaensis TaxID=67271 RepID=A0ABW0ACS1_9ACTN
MPFTLSHVVAVLPGVRRNGTGRGPLVASALVLGSLSPDMTYFAATAVPGAMEFGRFTHAPLGVLTVDVAITAALAALWLMMRDPLVALLPGRLRGPVHSWLRGRPGARSLGYALRFSASAALGAASHVFWDSFTHHDRWGTRLIPVLNETVAGFGVHKFAQYGSSALSLAVIGWFTLTALRRQPPSVPPPSVPVLDARDRRRAAALLAACALIGLVDRCVRADGMESLLDLIPTACFGAGAGLAVGLVLYGGAMRLRAARTPEHV